MPPSPNALSTVTFNEKSLKAAIVKLTNYKATGIDNIPGEFIKHGGQKLFQALLEMFLVIKTMESMPEDWYEGLVKPLYKQGNSEELGNYRGITVSSIVYTILVTVIEDQVVDYVDEQNLLGAHQGAFRRGRRCEDNIFSLKGEGL